MRINGAEIEGLRISGADIEEGRMNGAVVFSPKPLYKQNGLMALFKGDDKKNDSPNKSIWKNLGSGGNLNLQNFAYNQNSGWTGDSLYFDGIDDISQVLTLPDNIYTMECVFQKPANKAADRPVSCYDFITQKGFAFGGRSDATVGGFSMSYGSSLYAIIGLIDTYVPNVTYSVSVTYNPADNKFYFYSNGRLLTSFTYLGFAPNHQIIVGQWATNQSSFRFKGDVFCIRVYNRYLNSEEVAYNYNIDKEAYGL